MPTYKIKTSTGELAVKHDYLPTGIGAVDNQAITIERMIDQDDLISAIGQNSSIILQMMRSLLRKNEKIIVTKAVRTFMHCGLKEAKQFVDLWELDLEVPF